MIANVQQRICLMLVVFGCFVCCAPAQALQNTAAYEYPFGSNPYLPSRAQAAFNGFLSASEFPSAEYCAACHQQVHREWRESAHANSFRAPFYVKNVQFLIDQKGIAYSRHCEGCHNPVALLSGALTKGMPLKRPFDEEGVTCIVCHAITGLESKAGTGSYIIGYPAVMLEKDGAPRRDLPEFSDILANPERHSKAVMRDFLRTPEFCSVCHKAAIPAQLNGYKWLRAFSVYDEWQQSSWSRQSALPFYQKDRVTICQDCHMQPAEAQGGHEAKGGKIASHRFPGANSAIPTYYAYPEQLQEVRERLRNSLALDFFSITQSHKGRARRIDFTENSRFKLSPGDEITVDLVIQNKGIGHSLVPEQRDFYECWVEFQVTDSKGAPVFHSGALDQQGFLDPSAHSYTNRLIDVAGNRMTLHQVWNTRLKPYDNTIMPGRSDLVRYQFIIPANARGFISLSAAVRYRRFRKQYTDVILEKSVHYPILDLGVAQVNLKLGKNRFAAQNDRKQALLRWNNYGISLLGQQQWWPAADAFSKTTSIDPEYVDGYVNQAIAEYSKWIETKKENPDGPGVFSLDNANAPPENFEPALQLLGRALAKRPSYARALFYQGLILRLQNRLQQAVSPLAEAVRQFPLMRQGHQELGYVYYLLKRYEQARDEFEAAKGINPDDVTACYYLSILYAQLKDERHAKENAQLYSTHRDDPNNYALNLEFVQKRADEARELTPYHIHIK